MRRLFSGRKPPVLRCLRHPLEFTHTLVPFIAVFGFSFQIVPKLLLDNHPVLENVHKILGFNLGEIMRDDDRCFVLAPALEGFEDKDAGSGIQCGCCFIYVGKQSI